MLVFLLLLSRVNGDCSVPWVCEDPPSQRLSYCAEYSTGRMYMSSYNRNTCSCYFLTLATDFALDTQYTEKEGYGECDVNYAKSVDSSCTTTAALVKICNDYNASAYNRHSGSRELQDRTKRWGQCQLDGECSSSWCVCVPSVDGKGRCATSVVDYLDLQRAQEASACDGDVRLYCAFQEFISYGYADSADKNGYIPAIWVSIASNDLPCAQSWYYNYQDIKAISADLDMTELMYRMVIGLRPRKVITETIQETMYGQAEDDNDWGWDDWQLWALVAGTLAFIVLVIIVLLIVCCHRQKSQEKIPIVQEQRTYEESNLIGTRQQEELVQKTELQSYISNKESQGIPVKIEQQVHTVIKQAIKQPKAAQQYSEMAEIQIEFPSSPQRQAPPQVEKQMAQPFQVASGTVAIQEVSEGIPSEEIPSGSVHEEIRMHQQPEQILTMQQEPVQKPFQEEMVFEEAGVYQAAVPVQASAQEPVQMRYEVRDIPFEEDSKDVTEQMSNALPEIASASVSQDVTEQMSDALPEIASASSSHYVKEQKSKVLPELASETSAQDDVTEQMSNALPEIASDTSALDDVTEQMSNALPQIESDMSAQDITEQMTDALPEIASFSKSFTEDQ